MAAIETSCAAVEPAPGEGGTVADHQRGHLRSPRSLKRHPAVLEEQARRAASLQLRIADGITAFAGSMPFVYLHLALFAVWMLFLESRPWPTLTLTVSLEAIFLMRPAGFPLGGLARSGRRVSTRSSGLSIRGLLTDRAPAGSPVTGLLTGAP